MSQKYTGGFITKSPVAPTTTAASGIWTLDQQQQAQKAGTWPSPPIFIEDLFSTYLYTGNSSTQTITNNIDLSGQGGLVWIKNRNGNSFHALSDTASGITNNMASNATGAQNAYSSTVISAATTSGFTLVNNGDTNANTQTYVSWTFREQPKFFDVVTYTGNGANGRAISHNLGSTPGCIMVKCTSAAQAWRVYHRSLPTDYNLELNAVDGAFSDGNVTSPTSTTFTVNNYGAANTNGNTYVAYLFAHDAGGFPASGGGSTNAISCGSYAGNGSTTGPIISLGYEPQWVMIKKSAGGTVSTGSSSWVIFDIMRGFTDSDRNDPYLNPNLSSEENGLGVGNFVRPLATGFQPTAGLNLTNENGATYIYIAIRRGPMKTPTVGTSVFLPSTAPATTPFNVGFPPDLALWSVRDSTGNKEASVRLQGGSELFTNSTAVENSGLDIGWASKTNFWYQNVSGGSIINWLFRRAPGFCDVVCYTGTEVSGQTFNHNLGVVPEMMIVKARSGTTDWTVYHSALGASARIYLNATNAANTGTAAPWNSTAPTSTVFSLGNAGATNLSGTTFVNYLFATCAGVSKVGSYTGTGALQTVNCGFTSGARFVLIKRTDDIGDWWTYDSARGITAGDDPYLYLNSTAAEVTNTNYVDTDTTGFKVTAAAPAGLNANGGTYIFLAIA